VISPGVVAIKGHNSDGHSMISPGDVVTKGHNNDLPISSTLLTRIHAHQLLNIRQSEGFEDRKQLVLHMVLRRAQCVLALGASRAKCSVDSLFYVVK
jgi:hypothetical protein